MVKRLTLILVAALIVGLAVPAFAEVQNIKVSGDITERYVERAQMDLQTGRSSAATAGDQHYDDVQSAFLSTVRLRVDADLTDNVQAVVRLINERVWSEEEEANSSGASDSLIELDLAYITLKEFLYSPLTLILGRQPLRYGMGFIVGDPDTNQFSEYNHYSGTQLDTIIPEDLSSRKAFDAIRAILDYNPMVIDLIFAKIDEARVVGTVGATGSPENDDVDLIGANVAYNWGGDKNLQTEAYAFIKEVSSDGGTGGQAANNLVIREENNDRVITLGTRATIEPIERLFLAGEVAWQMGKKWFSGNNGTVLDSARDREAFAYQIIGQYALDMKYSPVLTTVFTHYSGDKDPGNLVQGHAEYKAWDPMFEDQAGGKLYSALFPATNCNIPEVRIGLTPMEDVKLSLEYAALILDEAFAVNTAAQTTTAWTPNDYATYTVNLGNKDLGQEVDLLLTYDYTEDVQFGLNGGVFMPGAVFTTSASDPNRENAYQVIGSVKVAF